MKRKPFFSQRSSSLVLLLAGLLSVGTLSAGRAQSSSDRHSFYQEKAARHASAADTVRLYFDRAGSLYPPPGYLPDHSFEEAQYMQLLTMWYYAPAHRPQLDALSQQCGIPSLAAGASWSEHWWKIQQVLAARAAARLDGLTGSRAVRRPIVTLIHGFNTRADEEPFDTTRNVLRQQPALQSAVWLEVYWDGLHKPNPIGIWGAAQFNGRFVGLGLRKVLCRINPATPLRIFTHSSGAIVASQALWNSTPVVHDDAELLRLAGRIPTPTNTDVRAGMIVPASTPLVYQGYEQRTIGSPDDPAGCHPGTGPGYHIVLGQNRRDYAVTKNGLFANHFGVTVLGCKQWAYDSARQNCHNCDLQRIEFSQAQNGPSPVPFRYKTFLKRPFKQLEKHNWGLYWYREQHQQFLDMVLN